MKTRAWEVTGEPQGTARSPRCPSSARFDNSQCLTLTVAGLVSKLIREAPRSQAGPKNLFSCFCSSAVSILTFFTSVSVQSCPVLPARICLWLGKFPAGKLRPRGLQRPLLTASSSKSTARRRTEPAGLRGQHREAPSLVLAHRLRASVCKARPPKLQWLRTKSRFPSEFSACPLTLAMALSHVIFMPGSRVTEHSGEMKAQAGQNRWVSHACTVEVSAQKQLTSLPLSFHWLLHVT